MVSSDEDDQKIAAIAKDTKTHHLQEVEPEKPPGDLLLPESFENKKFAKRSRAIKHEKNRSMKKKKRLSMRIYVNNMITLCYPTR